MKASTLAAIAGALLLIFKPDLSAIEKWIPNSVVVPAGPSVPAPSADLQAIVAPIKAKLVGRPAKAAAVAALYRDFAAAVKRDNGKVLKSTTQFVAAQKNLLDFHLPTGEPSIGMEIDAALEKTLGGKQAKQLDPASTAKLVDVLNAISWAAGA